MTKQLAKWIAIASIVVCSSARADFIGFDDLNDPTEVTNQYAGVTFAAETGRVLASAFGAPSWGTVGPVIACPQLPGRPDCTDGMTVAFAEGVNGLSFRYTGDNTVRAAAAVVDVYSGVTLLGSFDLATDGDPFSSHLLDLSALADVTRLVVRDQIDPAGLGFDDFNLEPGNGRVPEPGTLLLGALGLVAAAGVSRRRS